MKIRYIRKQGICKSYSTRLQKLWSTRHREVHILFSASALYSMKTGCSQTTKRLRLCYTRLKLVLCKLDQRHFRQLVARLEKLRRWESTRSSFQAVPVELLYIADFSNRSNFPCLWWNVLLKFGDHQSPHLIRSACNEWSWRLTGMQITLSVPFYVYLFVTIRCLYST